MNAPTRTPPVALAAERPDPAALDALLANLRQRLGDRLQTGETIRAQHAHSTTWRAPQAPDAVAFPADAAEVALIVAACAAARVPVIPFGAGTSVEGQVNAPAGGVCLSFRDMNRVLEVNAQDLDCRVQPGVTRMQLNEHLRDAGLFFPIDPGADASIGGMASTSASGTNAVRYGTMREAVLALEAVMPDGEIIRTARRAKKTSAGYDLTHLLVGAEGTLGVITEITLRLHGIPEAIASAACTFPDMSEAVATAIETVQCGLPVARMELLDAASVRAVNDYSNLTLPEHPLLLLEFHGSDASVAEQAESFGALAADHGSQGFEWTTQAEDRTRLWQARHDAYWAALRQHPGKAGYSTDVCVPVSRLAEAIDAATEEAAARGLDAPILGHVGDSNFHVLLFADAADPAQTGAVDAYAGWLSDLALSMDGTCTGEHGIGQGKVGALARELGPALPYMAAVKQALDPLNIMNPGKVLAL
ncbi:MAG: FAD-linked oxidase C-terminal domain-containing protein [Pseudomonadota bacterium]